MVYIVNYLVVVVVPSSGARSAGADRRGRRGGPGGREPCRASKVETVFVIAGVCRNRFKMGHFSEDLKVPKKVQMEAKKKIEMETKKKLEWKQEKR